MGKVMGWGFLFRPNPTQPVNWLIAHYTQPIVSMGQVKMGWAGPTRPIDDPIFIIAFDLGGRKLYDHLQLSLYFQQKNI